MESRRPGRSAWVGKPGSAIAPAAAALLASWLVAGAAARAGDLEGSRDPEGMPRYRGSEIVSYEVSRFDRYELPSGPAEGRRLSRSQPLEGVVTRIRYRLPLQTTSLDAARNYEDALEAEGFETLFRCSRGECGSGHDFFNAVYDLWGTELAGLSDSQEFLAAQRMGSGGALYAAVYAVQDSNSGRAFVQLDVVEVTELEDRMVFVSAEEMASSLGREGSVALYGILFDHDRAELRPASKPALDEIAKLLRSGPALSLFVVGHTDATGSYEYNLDLSRRRASSVVAALVSDYGIDRARLLPVGVGPVAPVASNAAEDGRARNRRVELVAR